MHPKNLSILDFTYPLPDEKVAKYPLENRDASKLLLYRNGVISDTLFSHIAEPHKDFNLVPHVTIFEQVGDFELELRRSKYHAKRFDHPTSLDEVALLSFDQTAQRWRQIAQSRLR